MRADLISRILGMAVFSIVGVYVGNGSFTIQPQPATFVHDYFHSDRCFFWTDPDPLYYHPSHSRPESQAGTLGCRDIVFWLDRVGSRLVDCCPVVIPAFLAPFPSR